MVTTVASVPHILCEAQAQARTHGSRARPAHASGMAHVVRARFATPLLSDHNVDARITHRRRTRAVITERVECVVAAQPQPTAPLPTPRLASLAAQFAAVPEGQERLKLLLQLAATLPALPAGEKRLDTRVLGCTSQTWVTAALDADGTVRISGVCALPVLCLSARKCGPRGTT